MTPEDLIKYYGKQLSPYERAEAMDYDLVHYVNFNCKNKGIG